LPPSDQPGYAAPAPTNGLAIASLVCALVGLATFVTAPVGAILGHVARKRIQQTGEQGAGVALAGIIIGWVVTGRWLCACAVGIAALVAGSAAVKAGTP